MRGLLGDAGITKYRIVQNRLLGLTLDFVVVIGETRRTGGPRV
jgi:hypothetical protein